MRQFGGGGGLHLDVGREGGVGQHLEETHQVGHDGLLVRRLHRHVCNRDVLDTDVACATDTAYVTERCQTRHGCHRHTQVTSRM